MTDLGTLFIANIKAARAFRRLTQKQLAAKMGVHRVAVTQMEMGRSKDIMLSSVSAFADALEFSVPAMLSEDFDPEIHHKAMLAQRLDERKAARMKQIKANAKRPN